MGVKGSGKAPIARRMYRAGSSKTTIARKLGIRPQQVDNAVAYSKKNPTSGGGLKMRARNYHRGVGKVGLHHRTMTKGKSLHCRSCGKSVNGSNAHVDHKRPLAKGGSNAASNLRVLCGSCNLRRNTNAGGGGSGVRRRI
jgi:5-methylcytosine-specific restriction endonuclease McrA